ncbi:MAG: hypothetical protein IT234_01760 [Bacteroidia bacterium]|nr:hypothetical protein [Bacteroidia bacterium]
MKEKDAEQKHKVGLRPYTKSDLAGLYEMKHRAFYSLFKPHEATVGVKLGRYYSSKQVEIIFQCLGLPPCMQDDAYIIKEENKLNSSARKNILQ